MEDMYNKIAQSLYKVLPDEWEDLILYSHVGKDVYEIFFYVQVEGKYVSCFSMDRLYGISRKDVISSFDEIFDVLYPDYEDKNWFCATVKLNNQGDMMMFYDYNDDNIEENQYREEWKKKYLTAE